MIPAVIARGQLGLAALLPVIATAAAPPRAALDELAGRYARPYAGTYLDGESGGYQSEDVVEITALRNARARVSMSLNFRNGHSCSFDGEGRMVGSRLVARARPIDGRTCEVGIWRDGDRLRWAGNAANCLGQCGVRGSLGGGALDYGLRVPPRGGAAR